MTSADQHGVYLTHEEYAALLAEREQPMTDRVDVTEVSMLIDDLNDTSHGIRLSRKAAEALRALLAERDALLAERDRLRKFVKDFKLRALWGEHDPDERKVLLSYNSIIDQRDHDIVMARSLLSGDQT